MIRPATCVCLLLAAGSGLYLYSAKHAAELETREIRRLMAETDATRARIGMMAADYQLENDPQRLGELGARFLPALKPIQPLQWTRMAELDRRLPPVGQPASAPSGPLESDAPDAVVPTPAASTPAVVMAARTESPHDEAKPDAGKAAAAKPAVVAMRASIPPAVAAAPRPVAPRFAAVETVSTPAQPSNSSPIRPYVPPRSNVAPAYAPSYSPAYAPVFAAGSGLGYAASPAVAYGGPRPVVAPPQTGSALGMARTMTPAAPIPSPFPPGG